MATPTSKTCAGEFLIEKWSPVQWRIVLTNKTTKVSESIVMNDDALEELGKAIRDLLNGHMPIWEICVDNKGEEFIVPFNSQSEVR